MAVVPIEDRIQSLLERQVADSSGRGVSQPELEAAANLEAIAISLLLTPKSVLYVANLARNALCQTLTQEIKSVTEIIALIKDFGNVSYAIKDTKNLEKARIALLQIEGQDGLDSQSATFRRFDSAVAAFLNKQLSKNVRQIGIPDMIRPSQEAERDLPASYEELKSQHTETLTRIAALLTGVDNFLSAPFGTTVGLVTVSRVRQDIEDIVSTLQEDDSAATSRDIAMRLISSRSALRMLGRTPDIFGSVFSSDLGIRTRTCPATPFFRLTGPFVLPPAFQLGFNTSQGEAHSDFPVAGVSLGGAPALFGKSVSWPVVAENLSYLFLERRTATLTETNRFRIPAGTYTQAQMVATLTTAMGTYGRAVSVPDGSIVVTGQTGDLSLHIVPTQTITTPGSTINNTTVFTRSLHEALGFVVGQSATSALDAVTVARFINSLFTIVTATPNEDGSVTVFSRDSTPAAFLQVSVSGSFGGLSGAGPLTYGETDLVEFYDESGIQSPVVLGVGPGDRIRDRLVVAVTDTQAALETPLQAFDESLEVTSALVTMWTALEALFAMAAEVWSKTDYAKSLSSLDYVMAALYGAATPAQQQAAIGKLQELSDQLGLVLTSLEDPSTVLAPLGARAEREVVNGIISTLDEKKYDRALNLFLKCQVQEVFELDWQTVSFAGALMRASSSIARTDLLYPNRMKDERSEPAVLRRIGG